MTVRSRATQDRRNISRMIVRMDCHFTHEGVTYKAVMVDLSLKGAFFSATFLPPKNSLITVNLVSPAIKKPLVFDGTVIRGTWAMSDHGKCSRFGISFRYAPADLIALLNTVKD
ncbi:MAG TPA: PilZ domain-containing protein [Acidobacteriota bacterium]|nr:PilZ domain-containing protein [Acidobacteriota bacterium]